MYFFKLTLMLSSHVLVTATFNFVRMENDRLRAGWSRKSAALYRYSPHPSRLFVGIESVACHLCESYVHGAFNIRIYQFF